MLHRPRRGAIRASGCAVPLLLALGLFAPAVASARAAGSAPAARPVAAATAVPHVRASTAGHVTIIVLDMSGSMAQNDPNGIRCSAANAYIDLSGPGDYVGVIGLDNNNGTRGGPHDFEQAQPWAQPTEMATAAARQALRQQIAQHSNDCSPDGNTPTYDSLDQALAMLSSATHGGEVPGSVILLTDGAPYPDPDSQISDTRSELIPRFQNCDGASHQPCDWPVDTVALGPDSGFRGFLADVSNSTSGQFYDDARGVVGDGQPSPLNIAPFFVDIFARQNGRTVGADIAPTTLGGDTTSRDFQLGDYVDHLDVVAVKDQPGTTVTLTAPGGQTVPPEVAGTFVATDPHYAIFSIDSPQSGTWTLNVTGSGQFLMDSLIKSSLTLGIIAPAKGSPVLPLGQGFTVQATIEYQGQQVAGPQFTVKGTVTYSGAPKGGAPPAPVDIVLSDAQSPGTYQAQAKVSDSYPAGSYDIHVWVSQVSGVHIADDHRAARFELFPVPELDGIRPGTQAVAATVVGWDRATQAVYGLPASVITWLSGPPLQGLPAREEAHLTGVVKLKGQPYANAIVRATATYFPPARAPSPTAKPVPVTVVNDGDGRFHVVLPYTGAGTYTLKFETSGTFEDSHGDFGETDRTAQLTLVPATNLQEARDAAISLLYLVILSLLVLFTQSRFQPSPAGYFYEDEGRRRRFYLGGRPLFGWVQRNVMPRAIKRKRGLVLRAERHSARSHTYSARRVGGAGKHWFDSDHAPLGRTFRPVGGVVYSPTGEPDGDVQNLVAYSFSPPDGADFGSGSGFGAGEPLVSSHHDPFDFATEEAPERRRAGRRPKTGAKRDRRSADDAGSGGDFDFGPL